MSNHNFTIYPNEDQKKFIMRFGNGAKYVKKLIDTEMKEPRLDLDGEIRTKRLVCPNCDFNLLDQDGAWRCPNCSFVIRYR